MAVRAQFENSNEYDATLPHYHHQAPGLRAQSVVMGRIWRTEIENMLTTLNTQSRCLRDAY
jgi:hypothetical protein